MWVGYIYMARSLSNWINVHLRYHPGLPGQTFCNFCPFPSSAIFQAVNHKLTPIKYPLSIPNVSVAQHLSGPSLSWFTMLGNPVHKIVWSKPPEPL